MRHATSQDRDKNHFVALPTFSETFNLADYFLFDRIREGLGDKIAIYFGERHYRYSEIANQTKALRGQLAKGRVGIEQRVLIALPDSPAYAIAFFATLYHGAVVAMANPDAPTEDIRYLLRYTRARGFITLPRVAESVLEISSELDLKTTILVPEVSTGEDVFSEFNIDSRLVEKLHALSLHDALAVGRNWEKPPKPSHRDDVAIWLFTSGSTGKSKAAMHAHRDFAFNTECYAKGTLGYRASDITLSVPRLFFGYATGTNLMFPFSVGATVGLFVERPTPETIAHYTALYKPTIVTNVPTMMSKLLDENDKRISVSAPPIDFSSVRFHLSAGEALPPTLLERFRSQFGADVYDGIGSAEMFHIYCTNRPNDVRPGSLGKPVTGYTIKILSSDATSPGEPELAPGETGVMWVKGESVAMGYFLDRDKSCSTFFGPWCRTGDLFRIDQNGYLWFSGRADDLLKVGGVWVAPIEVEECLMRHPCVSLAAVIGTTEDGLVKTKAFVTLRNIDSEKLNEKQLADELREFVKQNLAKHKYPRFIVFTDNIPKNDRGKVDRKTLKERETTGQNPKGI